MEREQTESQIGKYLLGKKKLQYLVLRELGSVDQVLNRKVQPLNPTAVSVLGPQRE